MPKPIYPPLRKEHKLVFASAALLIIALGVVAALVRLHLIEWLLQNCSSLTPDCSRALACIQYWWVLFVPLVLGIALCAHQLTKSRLIGTQPSDAGGHKLT